MPKFSSKQKTLFDTWNYNGSTSCSSNLAYNKPPFGKDLNKKSDGSRLENNDKPVCIDLCDEMDDADLLSATVALEHNGANESLSTNVISSDTGCFDYDGFDRFSGNIWIYPTNYPVRDYQHSIVKSALFKNTLVALPTGLGKTFIAAVVLYNFYRWYPKGKIVFMAPTKPLVSQQIEACYKIMGIPIDDQVQITGATMASNRRSELWSSKRVFFATPQVINNDLAKGVCPANLIKCLVIDEAHKALGNHAYCQVIQQLLCYSRNFRVLALSATPGSDLKTVQQIIKNLLISHIELRTDDAIDIKQYVHTKNVEKVVVKLSDQILQFREKYYNVIDMFISNLVSHKAIYNRDVRRLSKFAILMARDQFRKDPPSGLSKSTIGILEGTFAILISLYHGLELLLQHGMKSFFIFLKGIMDGDKGNLRSKSVLHGNADFRSIYDHLIEYYGSNPESVILCTQAGGTQHSNKMPTKAGDEDAYVYSHPKIKKLEEVVIDHFQVSKNTQDINHNTRIMIFCQYRDIVREITELLQRHRPLVRPMQFVGHAPSTNPNDDDEKSGRKSSRRFTQKDQMMVVNKFRSGDYNTLVSTCVGEEGLDIGDVDLIVCYDSHKSPIRLVQRMGRTGRKRKGRIVMLVTEGKEERDYNSSIASRKSIHKAILGAGKSLQYYPYNPAMIPVDLKPICHKMYITVPEPTTAAQKQSKAKAKEKKSTIPDISTMLKKNSKPFRLSDEQRKNFKKDLELSINERKLLKQTPLVRTRRCLCLENKTTEPSSISSSNRLSLNEWLPWQSRLHPVNVVGHSSSTKMFTELLQFCDKIRESGASACGYKTSNITNKVLIDDGLYSAHSKIQNENFTKQPIPKKKKPLIIITDDEDDDDAFLDDVHGLPSLGFNEAPTTIISDCKSTTTARNNSDESLLHEKFTSEKSSLKENVNDHDKSSAIAPQPKSPFNKVLCDNNKINFLKDSPCSISADLSALPLSSADSDDGVNNSNCKVSKNSISVCINKSVGLPTFNSASFNLPDDLSCFDSNKPKEKQIKKKPNCFQVWDSDENSNPGSESSEAAKSTSSRVKVDYFNENETTLFSVLDANICEEDKSSKHLKELGSSRQSRESSPNIKSSTEKKNFTKPSYETAPVLDVKKSNFHCKQTEPHLNSFSRKIQSEMFNEHQLGCQSSFNASADMFAPQFDLDFDFGFTDFDLSPKRSAEIVSDKTKRLPTTPVLPESPSGTTSEVDNIGLNGLNHQNKLHENSHNPVNKTDLSPFSKACFNTSQSNRLENRKFFSELLIQPSTVVPPCAKVKPQKHNQPSEEVPLIIENTPAKKRKSFDEDCQRNKKLKVRSRPTILSERNEWCEDDKAIFQLIHSPIKMQSLTKHNTDENLKLSIPDDEDFEEEPNIPIPFCNGVVSSKNCKSPLDKGSNLKNSNFRAFSNDEIPICQKKLQQSTPKVDVLPGRSSLGFSYNDESMVGRQQLRNLPKKRGHKLNPAARRNVFICDEVEVSVDCASLSSDEEELEDSHKDDEIRDFVNDASQLTQSPIQGTLPNEKAMYLQSIRNQESRQHRSTEALNGKYKLAYGLGNDVDVFSQVPDPDISDYVNDSFCVENEDLTTGTNLGEITLLGSQSFPKDCDDIRPKTRAQVKLKKNQQCNPKSRNRIVCFDEDDEIDVTQISSQHKDRGSSHPNLKQITALPVRLCELCNAELDSKGWLCKDCVGVVKQSEMEQKRLCDNTLEASPTNRSKTMLSKAQQVTTESRAVSLSVTNEERLKRSKLKQEKLRKKLELKRNSTDSSFYTDTSHTSPTLIAPTSISNSQRSNESLILRITSPKTASSLFSDVPCSRKSNQEQKQGVPTIFIDNKEVSSGACRIAQTLRTTYNANVHVVSLQSSSYVVSSRCAILRKTVDDLTNSIKKQKLALLVKQAKNYYEKMFIIIEKLKVKKGWGVVKPNPNQSSNLISTFVLLSQAGFKVLHSDNQENTAQLLYTLAVREVASGYFVKPEALRIVNDQRFLPLLNIYLTIPGVSYVHALHMCHRFNSIKDLLSSSVETLVSSIQLPPNTAKNIYSFFRKTFDIQMVPL